MYILSNFRSRSAILLDNLITDALNQRFFSSKIDYEIHNAVKNGEPIPDWLKPGAIIFALDKEKREILSELISDDVKDIRNDAIRGF